jgi:hypothetical protein
MILKVVHISRVQQEIVGIYLEAIFTVPLYSHKTLFFSFESVWHLRECFMNGKPKSLIKIRKFSPKFQTPAYFLHIKTYLGTILPLHQRNVGGARHFESAWLLQECSPRGCVLTIMEIFMRKHSFLMLILFALILAACNADAPEEAPTARPTPTTETSAPTTKTEEAYPSRPEPTAPAAGYPAAGENVEGSSETWVILAAGEQCADTLAYPSSDSAVATLEEAGVNLLAVEETELLVCEACGCPTSAHYRVLISNTDLVTAIALGWQPEG